MSAGNGDEPLLSSSQTYLSSIVSLILGAIVTNIAQSSISELLSNQTFIIYAIIGLFVGLVVGILAGFIILHLAIELESTIVENIPVIGDYFLTTLLLVVIPILSIIYIELGNVMSTGECPPNAQCYVAPSPVTIIIPIIAAGTTFLFLLSKMRMVLHVRTTHQ